MVAYEDLPQFLDDVGRLELVSVLAREPIEQARAGDLTAATALGRALADCRRGDIRRELFRCLVDIRKSEIRRAVAAGMAQASDSVLDQLLGRDCWPEIRRLRRRRRGSTSLSRPPQAETAPGRSRTPLPRNLLGLWPLSDRVGVAAFTSSGMEIWHPDGRQRVADPEVDCLALAPDGTHLALAAGRPGFSLLELGPAGDASEPTRHRDGGKALLFTPDQTHLLRLRGARLECFQVSGARLVWSRSFQRAGESRLVDPEYRCWAEHDMFFARVAAEEQAMPLRSLAISADSSRLAVITCEGTVELIEAGTGRTLERLDRPLASSNAMVRFAPRGELVLLDGRQLGLGTRRFLLEAPAAQCTVSHEAVLLALGDGTLVNLGLSRLEPRPLSRPGLTAALAPNASRTARLSSGVLEVLDGRGVVQREIAVAGAPETPRLRFSDDGSLLLLEEGRGPYAARARLWSVERGPLQLDTRPAFPQGQPRLPSGDPVAAAADALEAGRSLAAVLEALPPACWEPLLRRLQRDGFWPAEPDLETWRVLSVLGPGDWTRLRHGRWSYWTEVEDPDSRNPRIGALLERLGRGRPPESSCSEDL